MVTEKKLTKTIDSQVRIRMEKRKTDFLNGTLTIRITSKAMKVLSSIMHSTGSEHLSIVMVNIQDSSKMVEKMDMGSLLILQVKFIKGNLGGISQKALENCSKMENLFNKVFGSMVRRFNSE